ncbi:MAG: hypothetical protein JXA67_22235 [Micromonosporaceae bacterium]|nr:hypothetical protein [Micromonosporaceae bacterium]
MIEPAVAELDSRYRRCGSCGYVLGPDLGGSRCPSCSASAGFTPVTVTFPVGPSGAALARDTRPVEAQIRAAYARLADRPGAIVPLTLLRAALPGDLDRETVDVALSHLGTHDDVRLAPVRDHHQTDPATQAAALRVGGYDHRITIEPAVSASGVLQRVRCTDAVHAASMVAPLDEPTLAYVAEHMGLDTGGAAELLRQRIVEQAGANHAAWLVDAEQGRVDGTLLYRADTDPDWVAGWTDGDRRAAGEAARRLLARAEADPTWAYVRERANRWVVTTTSC